MFRGNHPTRVDDKGRLKLPAEYKRRAEEVYGAQFYITSSDGKRAEIYPLKEWEKIEEKLAGIPKFNEAKKKFLDITNYFGQMAEMDAQGRADPATAARGGRVARGCSGTGSADVPGDREPRRIQEADGDQSADAGRQGGTG